jgi:hypothetical protein
MKNMSDSQPPAVNEDIALEELYGAMQAFRSLGFPSSSLYLAFNLIAAMGPYRGKRCMGVVLRYEGREFGYHIAPVSDAMAFSKRWNKFAEDANNAPSGDSALGTIMANSQCFRYRDVLVTALKKKGIMPPVELQ